MNHSTGWLRTYLTLRNGAKRSVSKGGNRHGAYAPHDRDNSVLRVPFFETLRFTTLLRMRWNNEQPIKHADDEDLQAQMVSAETEKGPEMFGFKKNVLPNETIRGL